MKVIKKKITALFSIYALLLFIVLMLILFPFVIIASLFGKINGGNFIYDICRLWADIFMLFTDIIHKNIFEAPKVINEPVIFVFNHTSYMDIPILMKAFRKQPIRILAKAEMAKVPVFGFIYRKATVMVDRSSPEARAKSALKLKAVLKKNISVVMAPEGTFNMTHKPLKDFYDGAFRIAIETQTPIQPVLFLDAYNRLHYDSVFSLTPGRSRAVFIEKIEVNNYTLQDVNELKMLVYKKMEATLIKYNGAWIKHSSDAE